MARGRWHVPPAAAADVRAMLCVKTRMTSNRPWVGSSGQGSPSLMSGHDGRVVRGPKFSATKAEDLIRAIRDVLAE